jgi:hypothetical protein
MPFDRLGDRLGLIQPAASEAIGHLAVDVDQVQRWPPDPIAHDIQRDAIQPWLEQQRPPLLDLVLAQGPIGTHKGVLGGLLGILRTAREAQCEPIQAVLKDAHQTFEVCVQVVRERGRQTFFVDHLSL